MIAYSSRALQRCRQSLVVLISLAAISAATAPRLASADTTLFDVDFNNWGKWHYTTGRAAVDFGWHNPNFERNWGDPFTYLNTNVKKGSTGGSLEFKFPADVAGIDLSGAMAMMTFDGRRTNYWDTTAEYDFRFSTDFEFKLGGKLPGLGHGVSATGGNHPSDNERLGYSARFMWRRDGKIVLYLYAINSDGWVHPETGVMYGENIQLKYLYGDRAGEDVKATPGTWYHIKQRIAMNNPGVANGRMWVWVNDELVLYKNDIMYRGPNSIDLRTDNLILVSFPGGGDEDSYISDKDRSVFIDNIKVYTP